MKSTSNLPELLIPITPRVFSKEDLLPSEEVPNVPIKALVVEMTTACQMDCTECTVYSLLDTSHVNRLKKFYTPFSVHDATAKAVKIHSEKHDLSKVDITFFGAEPLLGGVSIVSPVVDIYRTKLGDLATLRTITNGLVLEKSAPLRKMLRDAGVSVGVSLDGPASVHDRYRRDIAGNPTYDRVSMAIQKWNSETSQENHAGILVTVRDPGNPLNDPEEIYRTVMKHEPRSVDFLMNNAEVGNLRPVSSYYDISDNTATPYGDWFCKVFDCYLDDMKAGRSPAPIRTFQAITNLLTTRSEGSSVAGLQPSQVVAINTKGYLELDSNYNGAFDRAAYTGITVFSKDPFEQFVRHPLVAVSQLGRAGLSHTCQECPIVDPCGGGMATTRYWHEMSSNTALPDLARYFDWPPRFCADLAKLIGHIATRLEELLTEKGVPHETIAALPLARVPLWPPSSRKPRTIVRPVSGIAFES